MILSKQKIEVTQGMLRRAESILPRKDKYPQFAMAGEFAVVEYLKNQGQSVELFESFAPYDFAILEDCHRTYYDVKVLTFANGKKSATHTISPKELETWKNLIYENNDVKIVSCEQLGVNDFSFVRYRRTYDVADLLENQKIKKSKFDETFYFFVE